MFGSRLSGGLSIGKVIGGISKGLNVMNQIIPIYKEAKPIINNARSAFNLIKEFGNTTTNKVIKNTNKNLKPIKDKINNITNNNVTNNKGPTFFW